MSWMAPEKTNHLKTQFLGCTIYMLCSPLMSLLIHHPAPSAAWGQQLQLQPWLSLPSLSRATLPPAPLQAHLVPLPLVLSKIQAPVIHDWCDKCPKGVLDDSSAIVFPTCSTPFPPFQEQRFSAPAWLLYFFIESQNDLALKEQ